MTQICEPSEIHALTGWAAVCVLFFAEDSTPGRLKCNQNSYPLNGFKALEFKQLTRMIDWRDKLHPCKNWVWYIVVAEFFSFSIWLEKSTTPLPQG